MKGKKLSGTKLGLKDIVEPKIKDGRGGARPGAGRKKVREGEFFQIHVDCPVALISDMDEAGISNKTAYILSLISADLSKRAKRKTRK